MIPQNIQTQIISIWDKYIADNKKVLDTKGNEYDNIDYKRMVAIGVLKPIIETFINKSIDLFEFRAKIDSFNKQNNYWGFTSIKGQMFFNLLMKTCETSEQTEKVTETLRKCIAEPKELNDALTKIELLEKYCLSLYNKAADKRKVPNPSSVCYFLSYFWQIQNKDKWAVMFNSIITSLTEIGLWTQPKSEKEAYSTFFNLNEEIKNILSTHSGKSISNWDAEHSFWSYKNSIITPKPLPIIPAPSHPKDTIVPADEKISALVKASFDIYDYIPPITAKLIELGNETEMSGSAKGSKFEKMVCNVFRQLGFTVQELGQGTGREPDLIAIYKEDNVAFIIDAKAYANGYMLSASDDRAIRDYINHYCPKLKKEGIQRIGFIIVSNSFKDDFSEFINDVTWKTDIKRFLLLSSDALLHLLAYKLKDQKSVFELVDTIIGLGSTITAQDIIQQFDDI